MNKKILLLLGVLGVTNLAMLGVLLTNNETRTTNAGAYERRIDTLNRYNGLASDIIGGLALNGEEFNFTNVLDREFPIVATKDVNSTFNEVDELFFSPLVK